MNDDFDVRMANLKLIRNNLLRLHKILMDNDRANYESEFGTLSSGKFLEMLLSDERFGWLRTISTLIVRIDEAFDLDDGISNEMLTGFYTETNDVFDDKSEEYVEFKIKLNNAMPQLPEAAKLREEIIVLLN